MKIILISLMGIFAMNTAAHAASNNMTTFLKSCAYGTLGGAAIGLGSLAVSENPSGKMSNVARGASLGLYAGIAYGLYTINQKKDAKTDVEIGDNFIYLQPMAKNHKIEGAQVNWVPTSF
jgi:hypothetical protein